MVLNTQKRKKEKKRKTKKKGGGCSNLQTLNLDTHCYCETPFHYIGKGRAKVNLFDMVFFFKAWGSIYLLVSYSWRTVWNLIFYPIFLTY